MGEGVGITQTPTSAQGLNIISLYYEKIQSIPIFFFHQKSWAHVIEGVLKETFKSLYFISSSKFHFALI